MTIPDLTHAEAAGRIARAARDPDDPRVDDRDRAMVAALRDRGLAIVSADDVAALLVRAPSTIGRARVLPAEAERIATALVAALGGGDR